MPVQAKDKFLITGGVPYSKADAVTVMDTFDFDGKQCGSCQSNTDWKLPNRRYQHCIAFDKLTNTLFLTGGKEVYATHIEGEKLHKVHNCNDTIAIYSNKN